jgi:hypothetical protein
MTADYKVAPLIHCAHTAAEETFSIIMLRSHTKKEHITIKDYTTDKKIAIAHLLLLESHLKHYIAADHMKK